MAKARSNTPSPDQPKLGLLEDFLLEGDGRDGEPGPSADAPPGTAIPRTDVLSTEVLSTDDSTGEAEHSIVQGGAYFVELERGLYVVSWPDSPALPKMNHSVFQTAAVLLPADDLSRSQAPDRKPAVTVKHVGGLAIVKVLASKGQVVVMEPQAGDRAERSVRLLRLG
jgi:hypothetical protein